MSKARFSLFRYQLLPKDRNFQGDLYGPSSVEELIAQKNEIFENALRAPVVFQTYRRQIKVQRVFDKDSFLLFRVAVNRSVNLETPDFGTASVDTWPKIWVAVWNKPDAQLIAIQNRSTAFQSTNAVMRALIGSIEAALSRHQLVSAWEPLFEKKAFWDLIRKHSGRIKKVEFELITPNMANISKSLPEDLKAFAKRSNAVRSKIALESDKDAALTLTSGDEMVESLASYTSNGGGNVSITLSGVKKKISTETTAREIIIDDAKLEGDSEEIAMILKSIME